MLGIPQSFGRKLQAFQSTFGSAFLIFALTTMKFALVGALSLAGTATAVPGPIGKVLQMIGDLEQKIIAEGETSQKVYEEHSEFCEDRNKELSFEIKTGESQVTDLTSSIEKAAADNEELDAKV